MDDLKLILYLLVGLGWLIMRNYRKVQQQRPRTAAEEPAAAPPQESAADAYRRMRSRPGGTEGRSRATGGTVLPETPAGVPDYAFGTVDEEGRRVTEYFDRMRKTALEDAMAGDEKRDGTRPETDLQFDLNRAVLYSEILKRPEW